MRVVFAGTPETAVPSLEALLRSRHEVAAVVTRPDARAGRGRRPAASPVARKAGQAGVEVLKPGSVRDEAFLGRLRSLAPECCPITAYGALIPQAALGIPRHGWVNVHFSLLPAWRGAGPVPAAIMRGDDVTGATTFRLVAELDAGPVYGVVTEPIGPRDTAGDLLARLAASGAELLIRTLDGIESGTLKPQPQPAEGVSYAPKLTPDSARVRWNAPDHLVDRQIRACTPAPGAWTLLGAERMKIGPVRLRRVPLPPGQPGQPGQPGSAAPAAADRAGVTGRDGSAGRDGPADRGVGAADGSALAAPEESVLGSEGSVLAPGEVAVARDGVWVGTAAGAVMLGEVQPPGKRWMSAAEWAHGLRLKPGQHAGLVFT